jgi:hypothetical protein
LFEYVIVLVIKSRKIKYKRSLVVGFFFWLQPRIFAFWFDMGPVGAEEEPHQENKGRKKKDRNPFLNFYLS